MESWSSPLCQRAISPVQATSSSSGGVTENGNILVADPASVRRSNQDWALGIITNEASRRAGSGGPFWVLSN